MVGLHFSVGSLDSVTTVFILMSFTCPAKKTNNYKYSCSNTEYGLKHALHNEVAPDSTIMSSFLIISVIPTCTDIRN
jgi:hypothetical protein